MEIKTTWAFGYLIFNRLYPISLEEHYLTWSVITLKIIPAGDNTNFELLLSHSAGYLLFMKYF